MTTVYKCDKCGEVTRESEVTAYTPEKIVHLCKDCWPLFRAWIREEGKLTTGNRTRQNEFNFLK